jgi:hypothetical protein
MEKRGTNGTNISGRYEGRMHSITPTAAIWGTQIMYCTRDTHMGTLQTN